MSDISSEGFFFFENDGSDILKTNFWESPWEQNGYFMLTSNLDTWRLLIPKRHSILVTEIGGTEYVILTRGKMNGLNMFEILFEDHTSAPYSIHLSSDQVIKPYSIKNKLMSLWTHLEGQTCKKCCTIPVRFRESLLPNLSKW